MFGNILKELRNKKELSQEQLANIIGVSKSTIGMYEQGNRMPKADATLKRIAEYFDVSVDYLLGLSSSTVITNNFSHFEQHGIKPIQTKKFRMLGNIACGEPIFADEKTDIYIEADSDINADFCLRAQGDSMTGARIYDGDIVFIRQQDMVDNGEIAAVLIDDEATLKRVQYNREANTLLLFAENPKYKTLCYSGEQLNQIRILGKAVAFQSIVR